jgi:hypothetical protein
VSRLPGRDALEAELDTVEKPAPRRALEPKVVPWDHRRPANALKPPPTLRERLRALFVRR